MKDDNANLSEAGIDLGSPDMSPESVRARMAQFCAWFGVEPVRLTVRRGAVSLSTDVLAWCAANGASIDWLFFGEVRGLAAAFRDRHASLADMAGEPGTRVSDLKAALAGVPVPEKRMLLECLRDYRDGRATIDEAMTRLPAMARPDPATV